ALDERRVAPPHAAGNRDRTRGAARREACTVVGGPWPAEPGGTRDRRPVACASDLARELPAPELSEPASDDPEPTGWIRGSPRRAVPSSGTLVVAWALGSRRHSHDGVDHASNLPRPVAPVRERLRGTRTRSAGACRRRGRRHGVD